MFCIYRSDAFENPMLQQHYRNLEALALDMLAPEPIEDLTSISYVQIVLNRSFLSFYPTTFSYSLCSLSAQGKYDR